MRVFTRMPPLCPGWNFHFWTASTAAVPNSAWVDFTALTSRTVWTRLPPGFAGWFAVAVYGLALGLVTSGFYDFANNRLPAIPPEPK